MQHLNLKSHLSLSNKWLLLWSRSDLKGKHEYVDKWVLQILHHHLRPGEGAVGVRAVVWLGFPLAAPGPHPHLIQDVIQRYLSVNICSSRRRRTKTSVKKGSPCSSFPFYKHTHTLKIDLLVPHFSLHFHISNTVELDIGCHDIFYKHSYFSEYEFK